MSSISSSPHTLTIGPGAKDFINQEGDFFAVLNSPVPLEIRWPGCEAAIYAQGDSVDMQSGERFSRLEIRNPTLAAVTVTIFTGGARYRSARQTMLEQPSALKGWQSVPTSSIPAATGIGFDGTPPADGIQRKALMVSNLDPNNVIQIKDANGNLCLVVFANTSVTIPTSDFVQVFNPTGAAISVAISELFYVSAY